MGLSSARAASAAVLIACGLVACGSGGSEGGSAPTGSGSPAPSTATSEAPPPAPVDEAEAAVDTVLDELDRRAEIAQLFVVGVPADGLAAGAGLVDDGVGGLFLAGRPTASAAELAGLTAGWQQQAGLGVWIAVDQEGGSVQTLKGEGFDLLPRATRQGDLPPDGLAALATGLGAQLDAAGINLNLAPVVDVVPAGTERANGPIGYYDRQYGSTAAEVAPAAAAIVDGLAASGVTSTLKHFPGLGLVRGNTDDTADVVDTVTTADHEQVTAFAGTLARTSADPMVMTSSATYTQLDPTTLAAFSSSVVRDLLRGRLAFEGPVISDDLGNARAVAHVPVGERAVRFLAAGGTLVLTVAPATFPPMLEAVVSRDAADPEFAAIVDDAVRTALLAKARAGLLD
ncbi:glycoside hydrolase family 3 N-terminal domain-containing protein [Blastococcus sp. CCUG 61487]|uniref:glycoside hydrolase family 3 N-terminal domain-containing protein n=1 Tax=Blastococcus sp. CCUG 61487 TaxID=1840703 RepID=UPI0010C0885D|nr:glycoside hydrolase family 3 N-terminal domain-containing protein [Blastococcus sp. CCUG 61487]TKJ32849.1 hypothetical protein A6V29_16585 [Blastococcus sp. CCUG 61487]